MSIGYDVAELLSKIKAKDEEIAHLVPGSFTEAEVQLAIDAISDKHTPDRLREMDPTPASAIRKLSAALDRFKAKRQRDLDLISSLTEEEHQVIQSMRNRKKVT